MILGCPSCGTRFRIDDDKVRPGGVKVRCSRCAFVFQAKPEQGQREAPGGGTGPRLVEPGGSPAVAGGPPPPAAVPPKGAREPAPSARPTSSPTQELDPDGFGVDRSGTDGSGLFADVETGAPREAPDFDDLRASFETSHEDLFAALEAARPLVDAYDPSPASLVPRPALSVSGTLTEEIPDELRDASVDLPAYAPRMVSYLDPGAQRPSTDLDLAAALEEEFLPARSPGRRPPSAAPLSAAALAGPPGGPLGQERPPSPFAGGPGRTLRSPAPTAAADLFDDPRAGSQEGGTVLARIEVGRPDDDRTRVAAASQVPAPRPAAVSIRRPVAGWPTWVGAIVGIAISALLVPGWAPPPLDAIATAAADIVHPAARLRLPAALAEVHSEQATAFPFSTARGTVVVVRGLAVNHGPSAHADVRATVLVLEGDREVRRVSAPLGELPDPFEVERYVPGAPDPSERPRSPPLLPGSSLPFVVLVDDAGLDARRHRLRVEFEAGPRTSASDAPRDPG